MALSPKIDFFSSSKNPIICFFLLILQQQRRLRSWTDSYWSRSIVSNRSRFRSHELDGAAAVYYGNQSNRPSLMHETSTVPCINDGNDFTKSGQHGALSLTSVFCLCFPVWRESGPDMFFRADGSRLCCCAIKFSFRMVKKWDSRCPCLRSLRRCCRLGSPIARSRLNGIFLKLPFL